MTPNEPPFYTVEQLAKMLGKKKSTVMRQLRNGTLKGKRIGRAWIIPVKMFEEQISAVDEQPSKPRKLSATTRNKMDFHAMLRSMGNLPERIAKVRRDIRKLKYELPEVPGPEYGAAIQKLKEKYALLNEMEEAKNSKNERIEEMSSDAYPEIAELLGRKRKEIIAILATGSGETALPQGEASKQHQEDDARRQHEAQRGDTPEGQRQPEPPTRETPAQGATGQARLFGPTAQQHTKTMSVGGSGGRKPPERDVSPEDDDATDK